MVFIPFEPIPIKDRNSMVFIEYGQIDVKEGAFVVIDEKGIRTHIPIGSVACLMLEPGTRISHAAVKLAAQTGTLLIWIGEAGVRLYSVGQPRGVRVDKLLYQAKLALDENLRLKVVRKMFQLRFNEPAPSKRSVNQLRGIEGTRVKKIYHSLARKNGLIWKGRNYEPNNWEHADLLNQCISVATSCLYGITEAAILTAGYAPAIGFIHTGNTKSFVFDIADLIKFDTVIPLAFQIAKQAPLRPEREVRIACRDVFRQKRTLFKLIPLIEEVLVAGDIPMPTFRREEQVSSEDL